MVAVVGADSERELAFAMQVEARLVEQRTVVVAMHEARDRFSARSRPPREPSESDVDALARAAREAVEHVAFGRVAEAQRSVREVIARAERTLESLNRETATARQVLDACLTLVRGTLQENKRELALEQATRCRRLVPDLAPNERVHPANVVGVLAEADDVLRRMRIGRLQVKSTPASGCSVYVNGRHLGTTPFELDRAAAGDYRVQVECGSKPARVHAVQLGDEPVELLVDTEFDRAIVSEPRLLLRYPDGPAGEERLVAHAAQLGAAIAVDDVVLVSSRERVAELLRVRVAQARTVGRASIPVQEVRVLDPAQLEVALATLNEARLLDGRPRREEAAPAARARSATPEPDQSESVIAEPPQDAPAASAPDPLIGRGSDGSPAGEPASEPRGRGIWKRTFGVLAVTLGVGAFATAYALSAKRADQLQAVDGTVRGSKQYAGGLADWDAARRAPYAFAAVGALATAGGTLTLLSGTARTPWWLVTAGGVVGLGLATWGIVEVARGGPCPDTAYDRRTCAGAREQRDRGSVFTLSALPFLALPTSLWLQHASPRAGARAQVGPAWDPRTGALALAMTLVH